MTPRIERLLERAWRSANLGWAPETPCVNPDDPSVIQAAIQQVAYWEQYPLAISDDEQIVGRPPHLHYAETLAVPMCFPRRTWAVPWELELDTETADFFREGYLDFAGNHTTVDYATILQVGFNGLIARIETQRAQLLSAVPNAQENIHFLTALHMVAQGYIAFCERYGEYATRQAADCPDSARAEELRSIAEHCKRVIAQPPTSFREACQALWFAFFFLPDAPGRVDVLLTPFYRHDVEKGVLTRDEAKDLLSELWIKYFEFHGAAMAVSATHHLTLGGVTGDGADAAGELTTLCLEVTAELKIHRPQIGLRWHAAMHDEMLRTAVRTWRSGSGSPDLCNDEQIIPALTRLGVAVEDARDYSLSGCQEVIVSGRAQMGSVEGFINLPKVLRLALGLEEKSCVIADAPVATFEDLWDRFERALVVITRYAHIASCARDENAARDPMLCASLVVSDCIENARGYAQGGARYNFCDWNVIGLANVADALMAIKRMVFETQEVTIEELLAALESGWVGWEMLRQQVRRVPSFGNDQDEVDALAARIIQRLDAHFTAFTPYRGGRYILGTTAGGENMHVEFGRVTGATPDGRKDGETLADSIGAVQGRDTQGVTALLNSVAKLPHELLPTATTLNVKLDPKMLEREEGIELIAHLIKAHFLAGGQHFQVNFTDREALIDARTHPERHRNLMVRVAGYSAQFVSLWDDLQEEIITRTKHTL